MSLTIRERKILSDYLTRDLRRDQIHRAQENLKTDFFSAQRQLRALKNSEKKT